MTTTNLTTDYIANIIPTINDEQFSEIQDLLEDDFNDLVLEYMSDSEDRYQALKQAYIEADNRTGFEAAHTMKGASVNLGLSKLSQLCHEMQEVCRDSSITDAKSLLDAIGQELTVSNSEVKARLK